MKCLEIRNGKGYFRDKNGEMQELSDMKKDDLLCLLDIATNSEESFEMDSIDEKGLMNQAHRVIYESLYGKFEELMENKNRFRDESASLYKEALEKYEKE